jgi:transcriptional regulator with XRE-family HTH domain
VDDKVLTTTSAQFRAARALVGLSQEEVSVAAAVSVPTLKRAESDDGPRVSSDTEKSIRSALEALGVVFIGEGFSCPNGGVGVRLRPGIAKTSAVAEQGRRHLDGKTIIRTQREWEEARPASGGDEAMRAFLREFGFDPAARIEFAGKIDETPKPKAGSIRRMIFDQCLVSGSSVEEVNRCAKNLGKASVRMDADLFIGLFAGYVRLP